MNEAEFAVVAVKAFQTFQSMVPIDTGNLRYNATRFDSIGNSAYRIEVSGEIAPYNVFTNEPWLSPKWKGKKNPTRAG